MPVLFPEIVMAGAPAPTIDEPPLLNIIFKVAAVNCYRQENLFTFLSDTLIWLEFKGLNGGCTKCNHWLINPCLSKIYYSLLNALELIQSK